MKTNNKKTIVAGAVFLFCLSSGYFLSKSGKDSGVAIISTPEAALTAIIKNDQKGFETFVKKGGDLHAIVTMADGKKMSIAEAVAQFDRVSFVKVMQEQKKTFLKQKPDGDMLTIAVRKNNPEMVKAILAEKPNLAFAYGEKKQNLLHITSESCADKVTDILHKTGKLSPEQRSSDGATALTTAARAKCVPVLTYWKDQKVEKVNFHKLDGKGSSVMSLLQKQKEPEAKALVVAIHASPAGRTPASAAPEDLGRFSFYKKRKIPKDELADHNSLVEPEIRPLDTDESAEHSEFAD